MVSTTTAYRTATTLIVLLLTTLHSESSAYVSNGAMTAVTASTSIVPDKEISSHTQIPPTRPITNQVASGTGAWRVALNIENTWPIIVKCDFSETDNQVIPQQPNVRYTVQTGEVVKPVEAGKWSLSKNNLAFSLNFPERMSRNELEVAAGSITCEGLLHTEQEIKTLNDNFYQARDNLWAVGGELNDMNKRRDAPKKWNVETKRWEQRHAHEPVWSYLAKRSQHMQLQSVERQENAKRPDPKEISNESGYFPGLETTADDDQHVFLGKRGVIKRGMQVIGTWTAEPINDRPVSYY